MKMTWTKRKTRKKTARIRNLTPIKPHPASFLVRYAVMPSSAYPLLRKGEGRNNKDEENTGRRMPISFALLISTLSLLKERVCRGRHYCVSDEERGGVRFNWSEVPAIGYNPNYGISGQSK